MASAVIGSLRVNLGLDSARLETGLNKSGRSVNSFASQATKVLGGVGAALAAAFSVSAVGGFADEWSDLNSRLANATGSAESGAAAMDRLQAVARASYSSISQTTEAFLGQSMTLNALGVSTQKQLDLTETLNNALVISATRGDKAGSVLDGWGKAMATGSLRGDNLNSVITNSSRLAQALADSLGINVTQLREYGAQGKITRAVMLGITDQLERLREEAAKMPATLADGMDLLRDAVFQFVGRMDQATGSSASFASMLVGVADAITAATVPAMRMAEIVSGAIAPAFDALGGSLPVAAAGLAGFFAPAVISGLGAVSVAIGTTMVGAVRALTAAMLANPLGLLIAGIAAAVTAAFMFRDQIREAIGVDVVGIARAAGNMLIQSFDLAFRNVTTIWGVLPAVLGDITISTANAVISGIQEMINGAIDLINEFTAGAREALGAIGIEVGDIGRVRFAPFDNPWADSIGNLGDQLSQNLRDTGEIDYLGALGSALGLLGDQATDASSDITDLGGALDGNGTEGGAAGGASKLASAADDAGSRLSKLGDIGKQIGSMLANSFTDMFMSFIEGGKNAIDIVADLLKSLARLLLNNVFQGLFGGLFAGGGVLGGLFGGGIPGFANGTRSAPGGMAWVGERGRELVNLPRGSQVIPNSRIGGGGVIFAGDTIVNVQGSTGDAQQDARYADMVRRAVEQAVDRRIAENMRMGGLLKPRI